jgi:hypothetical protein
MTDQQDYYHPQQEQQEPDLPESDARTERFPELAELEEKIQRRLRSNQRFLERFMDEDFDDLDDDDIDSRDQEDDPGTLEEL